ncbi:MAG: hypothetical protein KGH94_02650 [Candidatus Micrarchaeota archaeon]|nr:hypothetical protein [Candidatus Micrarchaeota archaeon]
MVPLMMLLALHGYMLQAQQIASLPINPIPWFPIAFLAALCVIIIAALIYMIAPVLNSRAMQEWSRIQIYEAVLSLALVIAFIVVVKLLSLNPEPGFASVGIVPQGCTAANSIYALSSCDLAQFNNAGYSIATTLWEFSFLRAVIPSSTLKVQPFSLEDGIQFQFSVPNILSAGNDKLLKSLMEFVLLFLLLSQVQLVLISSALLLMSFFFAIGLVARIFGISRSFGGAMIAFGIGLGILFPLLTGITYGYIDVSINSYCIANAGAVSCSGLSFLQSFLNIFVNPFTQIAGLFAPTGGPLGATAVPLFIQSATTLFDSVGYLLAGLIVIPVVNVIIVDAFVVDFSTAIGERMSFSMLFRELV